MHVRLKRVFFFFFFFFFFFCLSSGIRIHATYGILEYSHLLRFIQIPYLDKISCCFVPYRPTVEINIPYDSLLCQMCALALQYIQKTNADALEFRASIYLFSFQPGEKCCVDSYNR